MLHQYTELIERGMSSPREPIHHLAGCYRAFARPARFRGGSTWPFEALVLHLKLRQ